MTNPQDALAPPSSRSATTAQRRSPADGELAESLDAAIDRTCQWLVESQHADGHWCGELEGDTILESEYILLLAWMGRENSDIAHRAARYILQQQRPDGGWAMYPGGDVEISGSVKAYFALKLNGHDAASEPMQRARRAILAHGGADAVNSFTRFYLALLGQISYDHCPAVPPEAVLLPDWFPVNIYQISSWSRTILVPLAIMWASKPVRRLPPELGIEELFIKPPEEWPPLRCPGLKSSGGLFTWERFFRTLDRTLKTCESLRLRPLRRRALAVAKAWMLDRFEQSDGLGAIFPPIIWCVVALKCLGYDDDSPEVRSCLDELEALHLAGENEQGETTLRLQPCKSPVWDTAISLRALASAGRRQGDKAIDRACRWLLEKEVRRPGDWSLKVKAEPAGWYFEYNNEFYPDVDDTIMVMMALDECGCTGSLGVSQSKADSPEEARRQAAAISAKHDAPPTAEAYHAACRRGLQWILAMQNSDGGWGAFDKDNDAEFLCYVPFADHNAMIDPSWPDITARALEALAPHDIRQGHPAVERSLAYLRQHQEEDGAWFGRWGVNYIYGTWQVLVGLRAAGVAVDDEAMVRGADWLVRCQQPCGGWGESADSYADPTLRGQGVPTASQTAWALLGLMAAGRHHDVAVERGARYLIDTQQDDGGWQETEFTGTGFPRVFYLRYHMYPIYFPLLALATWRDLGRRRES
ncbi:MAG: prenyltransferase/squalene oxidase repeat-containing protein [Pirellulaceae bacterium]